jgi:hypothetical protein
MVVAGCESNQQQQKDCFHNDARSTEYKRIWELGCQHFSLPDIQIDSFTD